MIIRVDSICGMSVCRVLIQYYASHSGLARSALAE